MLEILLFSLGVMYTPGPVNILSFNNGLQKKLRAHVPFALGVASGLCIWFILVGYAGASVVDEAMLPLVGGLGVCFILYLAYKVMVADVEMTRSNGEGVSLRYRDGLLMQLLNPKALMVAVPVATVQFPSVGIAGVWIAVWSVGLSALAFGAPTSYAALGGILGKRVNGVRYFRWINTAMAVLLLAVALDMAYREVFLPLVFR